MAETVRVKVTKPRGSGRREGWNKLVTRVDDTKSGGYAFQGRFLDERQEDLKVGSVLVGQTPVGSAKDGNHWRVGVVGVVGAGGVEWENTSWPLDDFLDFRDHVKALLCKPKRHGRGSQGGEGAVAPPNPGTGPAYRAGRARGRIASVFPDLMTEAHRAPQGPVIQ